MLDFSIVVFFIVIGLDLQRYNLFFNIQIFLQFFSFFSVTGFAVASQTTRAQLKPRRLLVYETTRLQAAAA